MNRTYRRCLVPLIALALLAAACGDEEGDDGDRGDGSAPTTEAGGRATTGAAGLEGDITVFAAASLAEAFTEVNEAFTAAHPEVTVESSFDGSSTLVQQIIQGAPADVFASADTANMDKLVEAGLDGGDPVVFATNRLVIIVAPGNPLGITGVADLANPDLTTVICAPEVPCGRYAEEVFTKAGVAASVDSLEQNVRGVVTKVTAGEADAGIVYVTDVTAAGDAASHVDIPDDLNVVAEYPISTVEAEDSGNAPVAEAFIEFLTGPDGQAVLAAYGFGPPTEP